MKCMAENDSGWEDGKEEEEVITIDDIVTCFSTTL